MGSELFKDFLHYGSMPAFIMFLLFHYGETSVLKVVIIFVVCLIICCIRDILLVMDVLDVLDNPEDYKRAMKDVH